jgi:hypothetical protein
MSLDFSPGWCAHCQNTGHVNCYCGGDLCICENNGEEPCPFCDGTGDDFYCDDVEEGYDAGEWNNEPKQPSSKEGA